MLIHKYKNFTYMQFVQNLYFQLQSISVKRSAQLKEENICVSKIMSSDYLLRNIDNTNQERIISKTRHYFCQCALSKTAEKSKDPPPPLPILRHLCSSIEPMFV